jgi:hypothetical protein
MKTYIITNWTMENHQSIFGAFVLRGLIQGHPTIADGTQIRTTAVTSMDNEAGIAYTHHSGAFKVSTDTMSADWASRVTADGGDKSSFLQDSFEQGPFDSDLDQTDSDQTGQDSDSDGSTDSLGDGSDADMGGLPPGLLALLQSLGDGPDGGPDDALAGDDASSDDVVQATTPVRRSHRTKSAV